MMGSDANAKYRALRDMALNMSRNILVESRDTKRGGSPMDVGMMGASKETPKKTWNPEGPGKGQWNWNKEPEWEEQPDLNYFQKGEGQGKSNGGYKGGKGYGKNGGKKGKGKGKGKGKSGGKRKTIFHG